MRDLLEKWKANISETDEQIERFRDFFNVFDCEFLHSIEKLQTEYTHQVAQAVGDTRGSLMWFWLENKMGADELWAGYGVIMKPITGLDALEALIIEGMEF
jgi:predicted choloylglycine hydrolase